MVFEAFNQVDGSTSRRYGGTGLGLTISRELADLIGGQIAITSREGSGSTFTLVLPLTLDEYQGRETMERSIPETGKADTAAQRMAIPDARYPGKRVLVVDDDLRNLLALTPLLEHWEIEVVAAGDGHEALETLHEDSDFDLVLIDLMMPGMDGFETIEKIRADADLKVLSVVALTAKAADEDRSQAIASGANDFLAKPVEPVDLKLILDQYLGARHTESSTGDRERSHS